ncbi:MAG TPA: hypothetical protein VMG62_03840 [Solirubrobacteraceae bacterium]|nr:hypothetical protein [Solirubrobacteraceae bacterium]
MSDATPHIRHRVQLPDGKHVEIVYRDYRSIQANPITPVPDSSSQPLPEPPPTPPTPSPASPPASPPSCEPQALHVCFNCSGELVYPLDWSEEGDRHWRIMLRCPECEACREGVFEQSVVERLDDELDRATGELLGDLRQITHANMTDEIEFFVRALNADLITPADF